MSAIFFRPSSGAAADFIPFYKDGVFYLFYLQDFRDIEKEGEGTPWYLVETRDFVTFSQPREVLPRGTKTEQDYYVFTGSVIEKDGLYHCFYTGHNPYLAENGCVEGIMHAVSTDLYTWEKYREDTFFADPSRFEKDDWRDPFVFYHEPSGEYWMLLAAKLLEGPVHQRGCTVLCTSKDLRNWEIQDALWAPGLYSTHECPDVFRIGDWWYLIFSEFSDRSLTRYRMAKSLRGPWICPEKDSFDTRAYYAAKTAFDGKNRYLFGWLSSRDGETDKGGWQWGGSLVVHQLVQSPDGTLSVRIPDTVAGRPGQPVPLTLGTETILQGNDSVQFTGLPKRCRITAEFTINSMAGEFGLFLRSDKAREQQYIVRCHCGVNMAEIDVRPRYGDSLEMTQLRTNTDLSPGAHSCTILLDESACVVYFDDKTALSGRLYDHNGSDWGFYTKEACITVQKIQISSFL